MYQQQQQQQSGVIVEMSSYFRVNIESSIQLSLYSIFKIVAVQKFGVLLHQKESHN
jgi:hypothetical protein